MDCKISDRPLASLCIACYNQKDYIRDALSGAFNQTYEPLEIVICDDCSTDGTDGIIEEMIGIYRANGGRHSVQFRHNEINLRDMKNYEQALCMAHGELLITAAGDDIPMPERVESIVRAWLNTGKKATVIFHGLYPMSVDGQVQDRDWWEMTIRNPIGAAMAYSSLVVGDKFPNVGENHAFEDNVFARRAYAFGNPLYLTEKLVKYRVGSGCTSALSYAHNRQKISFGMICSARQNLIDMVAVEGVAPPEKIKEIREMAYEIMDSYGIEYGYNPLRKFGCYLRACRRRGWRWYGRRNMIHGFLLCGYPGQLLPVLHCCARLKNFILGK